MDITSSTSVSNQLTTEQAREIIDDNTLDKDAFFKLLITQLQNQDPLKPMEDKEFIAQMAQFSSLEQMQNMNKNMEKLVESNKLSQCAALIGKTVEKISGDEIIAGKVEKVTFEDGNSYVILADETKLAMEEITTIREG